MNISWKEIRLNQEKTYFEHNGHKVFEQEFISAMKFHEPGLAPVQEKSGWYHITVRGTPLYSQRYRRAFGYYCERAGVADRSGWFHIDDNGESLYENRYDWVGNYQEERCAVRTFSGHYLHIDLSGKPLYSFQYRYAGDFRDGVASVMREDGLFIHINLHGDVLHSYAYFFLGVFHKGFALAKDEKGWFHIDITGKPIYESRFAQAEPFYNDFALVETWDKERAIIDYSGQIIKTL